MNLTPTSYAVLGLIATFGPVTSYDLKRMVAESIGYLWSFPHTQLYTEPERLAAAGLLSERRESEGRRRRHYTITESGWKALEAWLEDPAEERIEIRDVGLMKLFFGFLARPGHAAALAGHQAAVHRRRLMEFEDLKRQYGHVPAFTYQQETVRLGIQLERAAVRFWEQVAANPPPDDVTPGRAIDADLARAVLFDLWEQQRQARRSSG